MAVPYGFFGCRLQNGYLSSPPPHFDGGAFPISNWFQKSLFLLNQRYGDPPQYVLNK